MAPLALQKITEEVCNTSLTGNSSLMNAVAASCIAVSASLAGLHGLPVTVKRAALPLGLVAAATTYKLSTSTHHAAARPESSVSR